jgi:ribosomal protein S25
MGGQKKPTITKLKKMMAKSRSQKASEEKRKTVYKYNLPSGEEKEIMQFIMKSKYITPYILTKKMDLKISKSRTILRRLASEGKLKLVEKNRDLEVYVPTAA